MRVFLVALLVVFGVAPASTRAGDVVATLIVKGRAPKTGYSRDQFGAAWADVDRNGCDTRDDILNRDLTHKQWRPGTHGCVVVVGVLDDPYTGRALTFAKANAAAVQIDHVVALSDAWQKGAAVVGRRAPAQLRQRPVEPAGRRRPDQRTQERRRRRDLAAARSWRTAAASWPAWSR